MAENTDMESKIIMYLSKVYPKTVTLPHLQHHLVGVSNKFLIDYLYNSEKIVRGKRENEDLWGIKKPFVVKPQTRPSEDLGVCFCVDRLVNYVRPTKPDLKDQNFVRRHPASANVFELFKYCVHKVVGDGIWKDLKNHNSWANAIFKYESEYINRENLMSKVKSEFAIYFKTQKNTQYQFDMDKIMDHYPMWFKGCGWKKPKDPLLALHYDVIHAIYKEFSEASIAKNMQEYKVDNLLEIGRTEKNYIYVAQLVVNEGDEPRLREGVTVKLKIGRYAYQCEVVEFNNETAELTLTSLKQLSTEYSHMQIIVDTTFILKKLCERWNVFANSEPNEELPVYKFISGDTNDVYEVEYTPDEAELLYGLDKSQLRAYHAALGEDLTMIWGPPGTGKSFTLAAIIRSLYKQPDERTVVCCVSNVAVDQLVNKVVDILEQEKNLPGPGNYYRAGHTIDERIIGTDFLFPNDKITKEIRRNIQEKKKEIDILKKRGDELSQTHLKIEKAELKDLREQLKEHTNHLVQNSKVVFSTISNFIIDEILYRSKFDNLIVDEASMLAIPQLVAIARKVTKRIILVGDFKQLSPIALVPDPHLRNNVFSLCGISNGNIDEHLALYPLLNQRRSYKSIVDLINKRFYDGQLNPKIQEHQPPVDLKPFPGKSIVTIDTKGSEFRYTKGGTRQNKHSANRVIELLNVYSQQDLADYTIGVITPYKGQSALIKALIMEQEYTKDFQKHIKVGTVHTFQGSECDIIICDFVDSKNAEKGNKPGLGRIYGGKEGEQLLNVAVSRARHKLIVLGDMDYLSNPGGNIMSNTTMHIFQDLKCYKI